MSVFHLYFYLLIERAVSITTKSVLYFFSNNNTKTIIKTRLIIKLRAKIAILFL